MTKKSYFPLLIIGILFFLIYLVGVNFPEETIRETINSAGHFGIVVFIFLLWLTHIFAPLSASPFLFAGFYLFGQTVIIYSYIAAVIASITNFWISRIWGRALVERLTRRKNLEKIDNLAKNYGFQTLVIFRVFLWQYHDVVSYAFGLTKIRFPSYLLISAFGMIPGTLFWYYLSSKTEDAITFTILTFVMASISLTIYIVWIKIKNKQMRKK